MALIAPQQDATDHCRHNAHVRHSPGDEADTGRPRIERSNRISADRGIGFDVARRQEQHRSSRSEMGEDLVEDLQPPSALARHVDELTVDARQSAQQRVFRGDDAQIGSIERCKDR